VADTDFTDFNQSPMKITLLGIGKTDRPYLKEGISLYEKRIVHYLPFEMRILPDIKTSKGFSKEKVTEQEGIQLLAALRADDLVVLLDERGTEMNSLQFAAFIEKKMTAGTRNLVFIAGGPYGFSQEVYKRSSQKISLSKMTFSHQMVRLIFAEQLYRAMTIIKGEPYHHS
jgi:23S rRNA (pseudouridine1915-N3)-methyltransferase